MENEYLRDITYPDEDEIKAAQLACCGRVCRECEAPAAYAWRKREVDLALLLEKAIENELTEHERSIVENIWYDSMTVSQIARSRGVSSAAVRKASERALEKLERVLKYVVFYQQDIMNESIVPASVGRARVIAAARHIRCEEVGLRIRYLRLGQGYSLIVVCAATGIERKRLCEIENGGIPDLDEIVILSEFFGVTADCILKGENNV